eukprot:CAMPEP_0181169530 /NCGR_PEP_ID=MMETSP1096-20121128/866_1 /TAXON_ID=156174 ORGANISM="Chrysochromulina ericina, Strain CCMP281" /NCGR_SAMPLE_ID=MMETSP1096 /ASSEMBLY_ACC=CAM_ASM_000453 /LENGTH=45 /DNA_ID= /DNA_START= /DNA_END= /DNA_ORIENTATION=
MGSARRPVQMLAQPLPQLCVVFAVGRISGWASAAFAAFAMGVLVI